MMNGDIVMKVKGDHARMEMPNPMGGQSIAIIDMGKGKMTTLMPAQKVAMEMDLAAIKAQAETMQKAAGVDPATIKPVATGKKMKVGEWDAEEYTVAAGGITMHLWVAPGFPHGKEVAAELAPMSKMLTSGAPDPNSMNLPGMVVKTETDTPMGKMTSTLKSAQQTPVADSEFVVPAGYNVMQPPAGFGGGK